MRTIPASEFDTRCTGEPLVLVHGWSCEGRYWREFGYVSALSADFMVIVPDLRGHGDSDKPTSGDFSDAAFASDIIAVLDDMGVQAVHVCGYSLGGWVVFDLATNHRTRIKTAIVGGVHPYAEDTSALRNLSGRDLVNYWEAVRAPLSDDSKQRIAAFNQLELANMIPDRLDTSERLASSGVCTLMMCGTNDARFEGMRRFATDCARCTFVPLPDTDHLQAWFRSDRMISEVQRFLRTGIT